METELIHQIILEEVIPAEWELNTLLTTIIGNTILEREETIRD